MSVLLKLGLACERLFQVTAVRRQARGSIALIQIQFVIGIVQVAYLSCKCSFRAGVFREVFFLTQRRRVLFSLDRALALVVAQYIEGQRIIARTIEPFKHEGHFEFVLRFGMSCLLVLCPACYVLDCRVIF